MKNNVDYASGDGVPGGDVGTFNQLYPLEHAYLGYMDLQRGGRGGSSKGREPMPVTWVRSSTSSRTIRSPVISSATSATATSSPGRSSIDPGRDSDFVYAALQYTF